jgi:N-acetylmuramoyl-L-alanine amidase
MKNVRETTLNPVVFSDNVTIDIPMAKLADLNKTINAAGTFVKSFEYVQYDPTTVRVTITTKGQNLIELKKKEGGIRLELTSAFAKGINYSIVNGLPQFSLNNERIGFNYFNYKYSAVGKKYSITVPASLIGLGTGRFSVNDEYLKNIDIIKNSITNLTEVQFNGKKDVSYITDTVSNSEKLTVGIRESSIVGTINQKIKDKIVVIDPGHGGDENGAIFPDESGNNNIQVKEKDLNLDISLKLYGLLKSAGIKTFITRTTDSNVSLNERADFANNLNADLFLSVHNNAGNSWENGSMALYYPSVYSSRYGISSERFAQITEEEMLKGLGTNNLGVWKRPRLAVLNGTKMPSVLAEVAYVSNEGNRQSLKMDSFRQKAAQSLYNSVIKALNESVDYSIKTPIQTGVQPVDTPKPEDFLSRNINGFSLPPKAYSKCEYAGNNVSQPSIFDLRIKLDYSKEISKKATLEVQRKEVSQILLSKLSQDTVNKIMEAAAYQKDFDSYIWDDEIEGNGYAIWVRCLKGTGVTTIDLIRK